VVHHQLGVSPDMGRDRLSVVPQVPEGQQHLAGRDVALGDGAVDVAATREGNTLTTEVTSDELGAALTIGHVVPEGAVVEGVSLDGEAVGYELVQTGRGAEVWVDAGTADGTTVLEVTLG
jgi:hypothetical protein